MCVTYEILYWTGDIFIYILKIREAVCKKITFAYIIIFVCLFVIEVFKKTNDMSDNIVDRETTAVNKEPS